MLHFWWVTAFHLIYLLRSLPETWKIKMCSSRKGHTKKQSNVGFSSSAAKYGTQSMLHDHMTVHYRRIASAKATIDTSPPKGMKLYIKAQDRSRREREKKLTAQSISRSSSRAQSARSYISEQPLENMNCNKFNPRPNSNIQAQSANDPSQHSNLYRCSTPLSSHNRSRKPQPTPRRTATPEYKLSPYSPGQDIGHLEDDSYPKTSTGVQINSTTELKRTFGIRKKLDYNDNYSNMDDYNRTPRAIQQEMQNSYTYENQQQSTSEQNKIDSNYESYNNGHKIDISPIKGNVDSLRIPPLHGIGFNDEVPISLRQFDTFEDDYQMKRFRKQEEVWQDEQKYLKFIEELTTDVLSRGIFSDRVLNQVFETHIEKKKQDLDEKKMWSLIDELKNDLNLKDEEYEDT